MRRRDRVMASDWRRHRFGGGAVVAVAAFVMVASPALVGFGESPEGRNRRGNRLYRDAKYDEALTEYRSAQVLAPELAELAFNAGNALFRKGELPDALKEYGQAGLSSDPLLSSSALYNAGNAFLQAGQLDTAVEAFKSALKLNPDDLEAKHNLEVALNLLEQQQQQQQQQQGEDQENQDQQDENQDQQNQDQQNQDQNEQGEDEQQNEEPQEQEQQEQEQGEQQEQEQQEQGEQEETAMSREDAERLLDAIEEAEKELQAELRAAEAGKRDKVDKDW